MKSIRTNRILLFYFSITILLVRIIIGLRERKYGVGKIKDVEEIRTLEVISQGTLPDFHYIIIFPTLLPPSRGYLPILYDLVLILLPLGSFL